MNGSPSSEGDPHQPSLFEQRIAEYAAAVNENRDDDARNIILETFAIAAADAIENPSQDVVWQKLADECEQAGKWAGAEEAHLKAIALARKYPGVGYPVKSLLSLAELYKILGRMDEAAVLIDEALEHASRSDIAVLVLLALDARCDPELPRSDFHALRERAAKALASLPDERVFASSKARLCLVQARCDVALQDLASAEACVAKAAELANQSPGGLLAHVSEFLRISIAEILASIHAARGDAGQAASVQSEAIERKRNMRAQSCAVSIRSQFHFARSLRVFSDYLEASGDRVKAAAIQAEAAEVFTLPPFKV